MKFGVVMFPGSNCDVDCFYVVKEVLKEDVEYIWHKEPFRELKKYDCIILPGGFSYGDYLRPGAIARFSNAMEGIVDFAEKGGLVLGICNGFQVLLEAGLLPGAMKRNKNLRFICDNVFVRVENNTIPFTLKCEKGQVLKIPIAHGDGNYHIDGKTLEEMKGNNQIVFRYCDEKGEVSEEANPNGSVDNIAGICNRRGNVLGMMPHPERCSEEILGSADGKLIFDSIMKHLKGE